jgi:Ni,Fe-hydrogenase III large subunit/Ni,Fe-hydrogenase III component G
VSEPRVEERRPPEPQAIRTLRKLVPDLVPSQLADGVTLVRVEPERLERALHGLAGSGARLADLHAQEGTGMTLRLVYALDTDGVYLVVETPVDGTEYPALSEVEPAALVEENEIFEQFGLRPTGGKLLNRVLMPPQAEDRYPMLGGRRDIAPRELRAPHFVQGEAFEFPFGPVRVAGWESLYMGLVTTGEEVLDLYLFHWHKHRGAERRLVGLEPDRALFLVERVEGLSAIGNGLAFCHALETVAGVDPPASAAAARAVALELERIYNHAAAIAMLCQTTGLSVGQSQAEIALEQLLRVNLAALGHRYLFDVLCPGGVRRAPDIGAVRSLLPAACDELHRVVDALFATNSHVDRLEACGIVTEETARRLALVGPVGRASGCNVDARSDHPWSPYHALEVSVPTRSSGDVLARMSVMVEELRESERLVLELLPETGAGRVPCEPAAGSALGWAESARGETLAWVTLAADGTIERARLRPASLRNWRAFDDAARSRNVFTDIPIIEASFWLTVAGFAR